MRRLLAIPDTRRRLFVGGGALIVAFSMLLTGVLRTANQLMAAVYPTAMVRAVIVDRGGLDATIVPAGMTLLFAAVMASIAMWPSSVTNEKMWDK